MSHLTSDDICRFLSQQQQRSKTPAAAAAAAAVAAQPRGSNTPREEERPSGPLKRLFGFLALTIKHLAKAAFVGGLAAAVTVLAVKAHEEHCRALVARGAGEARALMQEDVQRARGEMQQQQQLAAREAEAARERQAAATAAATAAALERAVQAARAELRAELQAKVAAAESQEAAARAQVEAKLTEAEQQLAATQAEMQAKLRELQGQLAALREEAAREERERGVAGSRAEDSGASASTASALPQAGNGKKGRKADKGAVALKAQGRRQSLPGPCSSPLGSKHGLGTGGGGGMEEAALEGSQPLQHVQAADVKGQSE